MPTPTPKPESLAREPCPFCGAKETKRVTAGAFSAPTRIWACGTGHFAADEKSPAHDQTMLCKLNVANSRISTLTTALADQSAEVLDSCANILSTDQEGYAKRREEFAGDWRKALDIVTAKCDEERRQKAELAAKWRAEARTYRSTSRYVGGIVHARYVARAVALEEAAAELLADKPTT